MIKLGAARKCIAVLANISLLFNSFVPFLMAITPVYAQEAAIPEVVAPTLAPETPTIVETTSSEPASPEPVEVVESAPETTPTPEVTVIPEITPEVTPEPTIIEPTTPILEEIVTPTPENIPSESNSTPSTDNNTSTPSTEIPTADTQVLGSTVAVQEPISVFEKVCLTDQQIKDTTNEEWTINNTTGISETKGKVQLGVRYVYPQENKVSVTFKCLPKDENLRTSLKIEKVKTADLALPDTMGSVGEYAFDITTGMKDGDFEYDVTLPKPENSTAEISYIEKSIDEAKANLTFFDINKINSNVEQSGDTVKATSINHFTIYIVYMFNNSGQSVVDPSKPDSSHKIQICHSTGSASNPYTNPTVDDSSILGSGHNSDPNDIIPKFDYQTCPTSNSAYTSNNSSKPCSKVISGNRKYADYITSTYPGKNWTVNNQAILNNGCNPIAICGNGTIETGEQCDSGACCDSQTCQFKSAQTECRGTNGNSCDIAETCSGSSATCPSDVFASFETPCSNGNACDGNEICDGLGSCQTGSALTCNPYTCDPATGCGTTCSTVFDCQLGYMCNSSHQCVLPDSDGDGDPDTTDCLPLDSSINHSATEICDGLDNNCDSSVDDGLGTIPSNNVLGQCSSNIQQCIEGDWTDDNTNYVPVAEICDGMDNNCDGQIDEGGVCAPQTETQCADGVDNDGDMLVDCADTDCSSSSTCQTQLCNPGCMFPSWIGDGDCDQACNVAACNWDWSLQFGYDCGAPTTCGNGHLDLGEQCDDGNIMPNDGCSATCQTEKKVILCHAAGQVGTLHYNTLEISENAVYGPSGHLNENGTTQSGHENDYLGACTSTCDDSDSDGVCNDVDNCRTTANANQLDTDSDGVGDVCDNCINTFNLNQTDADGDGVGDVCDNCVNTSNASQDDSDGDGLGSACDLYNCIATGSEVCGNSIDENCDGNINEFCPVATCGDGIVNQTSEQCDDGNPMNGDGCSATCQNETPDVEVCDDDTDNDGDIFVDCDDSNCADDPICQPNPVCGNRIIDTIVGEQCDDGNLISNDGCSSTCQTEVPIKVYAKKVVCDSEIYLPDNIQGAIGANTAQNWVNNSEGHCRLVNGWNFQYGGIGSFGDFQTNTNSLSGWQTMTTASGVASATINDLSSYGSKIEVREVFPDNTYIPFSNSSNNVSAEIYCTGDTANYDNWEWINNPQYGQNYYCVAFNALKPSKLTIVKQIDSNNDGIIENTNATDWKWDIRGGEQNITTGQSRVLGAGSYTITEDQKSDYVLKNWTCTNNTNGNTNSINISLNPGDDIVCTLTNTRKTGSIRVCKVVLDATGQIVDGSALMGSSFSISGLNRSTSQGAPAGVLGTTTFTTPLTYNTKLFSSGINNAICTTYTNLIPGNYYYDQESVPADVWSAPKYNDGASVPRNINDNFYPYSGQLFDNISGNDGSRQTASDGHIVLSPGQQNRTLIILNQYRFSTVNVNKFNDRDGNGVRYTGDDQKLTEEVLSGWTINLTGQTSTATNEDGQVTFDKLLSGNYDLSENIQSGWTQTNIYCENDDIGDGQRIIDKDNSYQINLSAGQNVKCYIGNQQITPKLTISKTNNRWPTVQTNGSEVEYTITLNVQENNIKDVLVTDLPPYGFTYKTGTWKVLVNGIEKFIPEPIYSSPGKWQIGDLNKNDVVTLKYIATIENSVDPGTYKDAAWAYGCQESQECTIDSSDKLLANAVDPGYLTTTFVGTKIKIDPVFASQDVNVVKEEGQVLGATTDMPSTGANTIWLIIFSILSTLGIGSIIYGSKLKRKNIMKNLIIATLIGLVSLLPVKSAMAVQSSNIFIRVDNPISPTNKDKFNISFTTLDIQNRPLTVKCFKVNPDSSETQIGAIDIKAGGNSGECNLDNNPLTENNKTYYFYAIASAGGEEYRSDSVAVDFNNSGPGTPSDYSKEKQGCNYKISFKASNDGKTNIIRIYRSDVTKFIADSGSQIGQVGISPNQNGSFTDVNVPDCNKTYYYVIRAFDEAGNGSGLAGDFITVYTFTTTAANTIANTSTTGRVRGAIPVIGDNNIPTEKPETNLAQDNSTNETSQQGQVLGVRGSFASKFKSIISNNKLASALIALILLVIIGYVVNKVRAKRK